MSMEIIEEKDWNHIWKEQLNANEQCKPNDEDSKEKALDFLQQTLDNPERIITAMADIHITDKSRVLDIGAGPGTLAIPLALKAGHVTAVEPSKGMADVLVEASVREGVENISLVRKKWEDCDPETDLKPPYDIVLAANSLRMPDIKKSIEKMCNVCSGSVYMLWFSGLTSWEEILIDIWPKLHGREYSCVPKTDVLLSVLSSMGIKPRVETRFMTHARHFSSLDAAVEGFRNLCRVENEKQERILRRYLAENLITDNGSLLHTGTNERVTIRWDVEEKA